MSSPPSLDNLVLANAFSSSIIPNERTNWDLKFIAPVNFYQIFRPVNGNPNNIYLVLVSDASFAGVTTVYINSKAVPFTVATPPQEVLATFPPAVTNIGKNYLIIRPIISNGTGGITLYVDNLNDLVIEGVVNSSASTDTIALASFNYSPSSPPAYTILGVSEVNIPLRERTFQPFPLPPSSCLPQLRSIEKSIRCLEKKICKHC